MMFYGRIVPLNRDVHANLRIRSDGFGFAAATNSVPLLAGELIEAAASFPLFFAEIGQAETFPIALLGLRAGQNLFVDVAGGWEAGMHVPAFVRRYPFVLSTDHTVCIDPDFAGFSADEGEALFTATGENTPQLDHALTFLRGFQDEVERTKAFVGELQALDLLKPIALNVEPDGGSAYGIEGLFAVDADKLAALSDEAVLGLFRSGALARIHAHLASLGALDALFRRSQGRAATAGAAQGPTPVSTAAAPTTADAECVA